MAKDIFTIVGYIVCWALAITIGFLVLTTLGGLLIGMASTGIGAAILVIIAFVIWRKKVMDNPNKQ